MPTKESSQDPASALAPLPLGPSLPLRPVPIWPWLLTVSGLYERRLQVFRPGPLIPMEPIPFQPLPLPQPQPQPRLPTGGASAALAWGVREELRLDVDGRYPQMTVSGTLFSGLTLRVHWIANLVAAGSNQWTGGIWYKDGDPSALRHTQVQVAATASLYAEQRKVTVTFTGGGVAASTRTFAFKSAYFHPVEFEFDTVAGTSAVTQIQTGDHPNRPASLPVEALSIETVYRRAGFDVSTTSPGTVPLGGAGTNARWSDMEMHDAMQTYWSRFANRAQWSMWVLFASLHEQGTSLGGVMFDDIGPNHRQGTAIFNDAFISNAPAGDANPAAWVRRMRFWTACHEMGHAFNLAHSWQKAHPPSWGTPWQPMPNEPEARSFMNYPYNVAGGQSAFFSDFAFRFSDPELLFMRHAPERFVQMGNANWFDHHGFEQAAVSPEPKLRLVVRANRPKTVFEFMEPVVLELKLTNISSTVLLVDSGALLAGDDLTVILKKDGQAARQWSPFARYCMEETATALAPGESLYESLFVAAGRNGWDLAEPGVYTVQVALHREGEDVVSPPLRVRVAPPQGYDEEFVAQDFFTEDVGRILTFDGSQVLDAGLDVLREVAEKFKKRPVAHHALVALGTSLTRDYKRLTLPEGSRPMAGAAEDAGKIKVVKAKADDARRDLKAALLEQADVAAETLGHVDYKFNVDQFSDWLADRGDAAAAAKTQGDLHKTLTSRHVAQWVLDRITQRRNSYKK